MIVSISYLLTFLACLLAIPVAVFFLEILAAISLPLRRYSVPTNFEAPRRIALLIPAHNESAGLLPTVNDIKAQLRTGDRLLVVSDNCSDDTAKIAAAAGAEVVERNEPGKVGKGYALDWGIRHLRSDPPDMVIIIDADCRLERNAINELATACAITRRPVQALYLMKVPEESRINHQVAEFAWRVKNWLRPLGLRAMRLPCQLMGTGMAFPWEIIHNVDLAGGWIVEDLKLGLDLTADGHPPLFCPSARVTAQFASSVKGRKTQRQRWEQGHIGMIVTTFPRLFSKAVTHGDWNLLALALDLAVPPLSLLGLLVIGMSAVTSLFALFGPAFPAVAVSATTLLVLLLAAGLAWLKCGRDIVPVNAVFSIPRYVIGKLGLYGDLLLRKTEARWIRTDRINHDT